MKSSNQLVLSNLLRGLDAQDRTLRAIRSSALASVGIAGATSGFVPATTDIEEPWHLVPAGFGIASFATLALASAILFLVREGWHPNAGFYDFNAQMKEMRSEGIGGDDPTEPALMRVYVAAIEENNDFLAKLQNCQIVAMTAFVVCIASWTILGTIARLN